MLKVLLTNIQSIARNKRPMNPWKSPYFDQKWGKNAGFDKNTDRAPYRTLDKTETELSGEVYQCILTMHKTPVNGDRRRFLKKITENSLDFLAEQRALVHHGRKQETLCLNSMTAMMDQLFEVLKAFAYELNNAVGFGPLHMAATNPQFVTEATRFDRQRNPIETVTKYRARLSTSRLSLVLRGDKHAIEFFILPADRAIGLSDQERYYVPICKVKAFLDRDRVYWETEEGKPLTAYQAELLCMESFHRLVEQTKAGVEQEELENLTQLREQSCRLS